MVFATSKNVTVPAGKKAKVKLSLPPFVRARLKDALGNGVRTVKADMVVQIATSAGDSTLRICSRQAEIGSKEEAPLRVPIMGAPRALRGLQEVISGVPEVGY